MDRLDRLDKLDKLDRLDTRYWICYFSAMSPVRDVAFLREFV
jgi:hypothetical protein